VLAPIFRRVISLCRLGALAAALGGCQRTDSADTAATDDLREVTFCRDIAPIVFEKCASCHRPGEAAPFPLLTYDDVRRRAGQIADVTSNRFMPPWLPKEGHGVFLGDRQLTQRQIELFQAWVKAGAPEGNEAELPKTPDFVDGWQLGTPDLVLESAPYTLAEQGSDVFRNFVIRTGITAPRWVQAIELRPDNPRVTHHARLGVDSSNESIRRDAADPAPGYEGMAWGQDPEGQLISWAPGMVANRGSADAAWRLHPNASFVLHTHMQPSGKPETVRFRIGVHFAKDAPREQPVMLRIGSRDIDIPAGAARHVVEDEFTLPIDVDAHFVFPHAHSLCKEVYVTARLPSGDNQPMLSIERFDENWHDTYRYIRPVRLPKGTKLHSRFVYDNSAANVRNRHRPPRRVVYGSNVDDEMADVYLQVTPVFADQRAVLIEDFTRQEMLSQAVGFRKTLESRPGDTWSQEGLAACYFALGKSEDAIRVLDERIKSADGAVFPIVSLAMVRLATGEFSPAEAQFRKALTIDADYPLAWLGLGKALAAQKKVDEAEKSLRKALSLAPGLSDAHMNLAEILAGKGQLDDAARACELAIDVSPDNANLYLKLAEIRARQQRYDDSQRHLVTAQRLAPYTHPPNVLLAVYCFQSGDAARARGLLKESHSELPDHPVPSFFLGQLARREEKLEDARQYLAASASKPIPANWPDSHRRRFLVLLHTERFQLAQQLNDEALARDAVAQWLRADPNDQRARQLDRDLQTNANQK
jgi:tetratricopeptide (TPR) repeat protein